MASRSQRIASHALASYVRMGLGALVSLAITRFSLRALGTLHVGISASEAFGALSLTLALSGAVAFVENAGTTSLVRALSRYILHDTEQLKRVFSTGWVIGASAGVLRAAILALLAPWLPGVFRLQPVLAHQMTLALYVLAAAQSLAGCMRVWTAALEAQELYPVEFLRILISQVIRLGLVLVSPMMPGGPFIGLALAWCFPELLTLATWAAVIAYRDERWRPHPSLFDRQEAKDLSQIGGWSLVTGGAANLFMRTDQIVATTFLGPAANAVYAVADQIKGQIAQFSTVANSVLLPTASKSAAAGEHGDLRRLYLRATRAVMGLAIGPSVVLGVFAAQFIHLWLGSREAGMAPALIPALRLCLTVLVLRLGITTSWNVFQASGHVKEPAITAVIEGVVNQVLSVILILGYAFGLPGVYLGSLIAQVIRLLLVHPRQLQVAMGGSLWANAWQSQGAPILGALGLIAACMGLKALELPWHGTLVGLVVLGLAYGAWMWAVLLDETERKAVTHAFARLRGKAKA
jgi:O-antigen/teichoic acid export membrane protein